MSEDREASLKIKREQAEELRRKKERQAADYERYGGEPMRPNSVYPFHPMAAIFPLLEGDELNALAADIKAKCLREAIYLYEGKILDGRNRKTACTLAGVQPTFREFSGDRLAAIRFVWSMNRTRRHLNSGQAAIAESKRVAMEAEAQAELDKAHAEAAGRKAQARGRPRGEKATQSQLIATETKDDRSILGTRAKAAGTNRRYLEAADGLVKRAESEPAIAEKVAAVEKGDKTLSQVIREVKHEEAKAKTRPLPDGKYRVIYADPPWSYGNTGGGRKPGNAGGIADESDLDQYGPAERHYPAMTIAELCAMDVKAIAADNAVLFLWVTSPLLDECWPVIKAWTFEYKTSFVWDKVKHNFGHYNSVRHEFLLVCTRGSCTPDSKELIDSVQTIERGEHSEKPDRFREIIEQLYPTGKRIELFARKRVSGWEAYGNES
jgi:N6-adenosine-specific RNA methylase IME4